MAILLLMPFHAFLTVWGSSIFGHYITLRLWKEALLLLCIFGVLYLLATDHKIRSHTLPRRLVQIIFAYIGLNLVWALLALDQHDVSAKAVGYGLIVNLRFLVFFLITWAIALRMSRLRAHWQRLVYWPAIGVVIIGMLQILVLPTDFLSHFGYSEATIPAYETVNEDKDYIRITSTLRGANPLGAYLLIPISLVTVLLLRNGRNWRQAAFLAAALAVLFFTYSRSALIGVALSIVTLLYLSRLSNKAQKIALGTVAGFVIVGGIITLALHNNMHFQNYIFHTQDGSTISTSSNSKRLDALAAGMEDLKENPLGKGPGTAGPASVYNNDKPVRIAENYYIQVGQEVGWLGLALFIVINLGVGALLYVRRSDPLALSLFASLIGLTFINMLSHAWADDTLAYVWWGLAGVAMVPLVERVSQPVVAAQTVPTPEPTNMTKSRAKPKSKK
jgi:hypothetical protein